MKFYISPGHLFAGKNTLRLQACTGFKFLDAAIRKRRRIILFKLELLGNDNGYRYNILMLHGSNHAAWCWEDNFMPYFKSAGYNVYALSYRGHGNSEGKALLNTFSVSDYAEDVYKVVKGLSKPTLIIVHSLGAAVVHAYLRLYPDTVCGIIFIAPVPVNIMLRETVRSILHDRGKKPEALLFDGRLSDEEIRKYKRLFQKEESIRVKWSLLLGRPKPPRNLCIPMLTIGSWQDKVVSPINIIRHARYFNSYLVMLSELCHDMMLEKQWETAASAALNFINGKIVK
ncbi:alpha-beta hydrolase superfamily lysophospholipase [Ruminiclostridium sufflavum DSM 19573]|uniref:Alpha-beta hydrolase superfamily lysophospholipase n=1 Tax=Ruminiclostridium sufflavum DSM 19573 TaxID=1121337 RepID=A0A318Y3R8_9FIRM|nr:alpha/beta fold hydrolase [Ruminiclostridium sufflavum]PYG90218.1 alpha-beta hydrolase superfamily lysophospholipase [Ruminiclostridium sufflavum DSM 19573]